MLLACIIMYGQLLVLTHLDDADFNSPEPAQLSSKSSQEHDNNSALSPKTAHLQLLEKEYIKRYRILLNTTSLIGLGVSYKMPAYLLEGVLSKGRTATSSRSHLSRLP